ncbi:MAG: MFS transporter [DPANN group archaeon]|nr:MFS transporter [DPANN group archaeon]
MSFYSHHAIHDFFKNKDMDEIYLSFSIMSFAESLISIFVPIYLYNLGFSIVSIIFYFFMISVSFVVFSFMGARFISRFGVKHSIFVSTFFLVSYYFGLQYIVVFPLLFYILPILFSLRMILFNFGFHLNYVEHSSKGKRGRELALIYMLSMISSVCAPFIGAIIIGLFGYSPLFVFGSIILIISVFPLFMTKDSYEKVHFENLGLLGLISSVTDRNMLLSFSGYAIESIIGRVIWPIFLIILMLDIESVGLVFSASLVFSLFLFYFIGVMTDHFDKRKVLKFATIFYFIGWIGRIFVNTPFKVFIVDSYKNFSEKVLIIPWSAYLYDVAVKRDYFKFIVQREIIYNLSRCVFMPILMVIFYFEFYPFILSFIIASIFSLFYIFLVKE